MSVTTAAVFAARVRARERILGYWVVLDSPISTERIARQGWDYVCFDAQHGLLAYPGILSGLMAVDAGAGATGDLTTGAVGLVRVGANDPFHIGQALDAGAAGVIVPLVNSADDARRAVASATYPTGGVRSYGPMRSALRVGPVPAESDAATVVFAMIETPDGLAHVEEICAVPGLDGVYVGPSDLRIAVGGASPQDTSVDEVFEAALVRIREAAAAAGVAAGIHTAAGSDASRRLAEGFTFATVSSDLVHLDQAAAAHLSAARDAT